jgi:hypothetical protein
LLAGTNAKVAKKFIPSAPLDLALKKISFSKPNG